MKMWLEELDEKRNMYHHDDMLWGKDIPAVVIRVVAASERSLREEWKANTKGVGLEATIHTDLSQTGGPNQREEHQLLQPGRQLNLKHKRKQNAAPTPTPTPRTTYMWTPVTTSVLMSTRRWETVPPRNQKTLDSPALARTTGSSLADRCLILMRD